MQIVCCRLAGKGEWLPLLVISMIKRTGHGITVPVQILKMEKERADTRVGPYNFYMDERACICTGS